MILHITEDPVMGIALLLLFICFPVPVVCSLKLRLEHLPLYFSFTSNFYNLNHWVMHPVARVSTNI
jgi:hypothetical protein